MNDKIVPIVFKINADNAIPEITLGGQMLPLTRFSLVATCDNVAVSMNAELGSTEVMLDGYFVASQDAIKKVNALIAVQENKTNAVDKKSVGIYKKFIVLRTDDSDYPNGRHANCEYFVLDLTHDKFAKAAILAYADACKDEYPMLASDLWTKAALMP